MFLAKVNDKNTQWLKKLSIHSSFLKLKFETHTDHAQGAYTVPCWSQSLKHSVIDEVKHIMFLAKFKF